MKKIVLLAVLGLAVSSLAHAQDQKTDNKAASKAVDDATQKNIRFLQAKYLSVQLEEYRQRDEYNKTMDQLKKDETDLGQQVEAAFANAAKQCSDGMVFNRSSLSCDPKPAEKAADKK